MSNISYRRLDELLEKRPLPMKFGQVHLGLAKQTEVPREQREPNTNAEEIEEPELEIDELEEPVLAKAGIDVPSTDDAKPGFKIVDKHYLRFITIVGVCQQSTPNRSKIWREADDV
jgi:hypothetical protein